MNADRPTSAVDLPDDDQSGEIDDDFLYHLYQGGELLQAGRVVDAKEHLEKAFTLKPTNPRGQNLLGLAYFKMGLLPRAIDIYRNLIERFGEDVTLRVNLGMVYIKAGMLNEAELHLRRAIELKPDHEKARRYLGLVMAKRGRVEEPRPSPETSRLVKRPESDADAEQIAAQEVPHEDMETTIAAVAAQGFRELDEKDYPFRPVSAADAPAVKESSPDEKWKATKPASEQPGVVREEGGIFQLDGNALVIRSSNQLFTRLQGLFSIDGDLKFLPVNKRFKGEVTKHSFDKGNRAMMQVDGSGRLLLYPNEQNRFYLHIQNKEPGYFQEDMVFAFSSTAPWENGVLPYNSGEGLRIFHLMGSAEVVFSSVGEVRRRTLESDGRIMLLAHRLVGWSGPLVPRLLEASPLLPDGIWIELKGAGSVFYLI